MEKDDKLKNVKLFEEFNPAAEGAPAADPGDTEFWRKSKEYNAMLDDVIPLHKDSKIRAQANQLTEKFKWEPAETLALCYNMMVSINEHELVKDFVELLKKHK